MIMPDRPHAATAAAILLVLTIVPACGRQEPAAAASGVAGVSGVDVKLIPDTVRVRDVVPRSTTLDALLRGHGLQTDAVVGVIEALGGVFDPRRLRSLQPFVLERTLLGALHRFEYEIDHHTFLRVSPMGPASALLRAEVLPIPRTREEAVAAGVIDGDASSLFAAMKVAGEGPELAIALASVFSGEIDFNSDVHPGDRFAVSFERFSRDGGPDTYGRVLAAEYQPANGPAVRAVSFTPPGGTPAFYDLEGRSLRRFFLKSPLKFEPRITSRFSLKRMHPVLHTARAHRGVDYAAPTGAPVVAVSAGTVVSASFDRANGRMVRLRHSSGYQTYYLHLSRFAAGIRAGVRVAQEQEIGYVGSTGLSTGPHLHYGLTKNGTFVNPLDEHSRMPPGEPIAAAAMPAFLQVRDAALASLATVSPRSADGGAQVASAR
jgi:murein DD-endopeptidase MepM/ murein hydrolase activator NlpD